MRAVICSELGPPSKLTVGELPDLEPGDNDVLIKVAAAGVNFPDLLIIDGKYQFRPDLPFVPGHEACGTVEAVGSKVTDLKVGARVIALTGTGAFAEQVIAPRTAVYEVPDAMDDATAASIGIVYATTAHALIQRGRLQPGETLLVHGATGGVGLSAVEVGKAMGATVIATGGSDEKLKTATDHGADHVINYRTGPFKDTVKELTSGQGADVIYDPVGGEVFDQSLRCINWGGRLLVVGFASGQIPSAPANLLLVKGCEVSGVFWGAFAARQPADNQANFAQVLTWWEQGKVRPHVWKTFPLTQVADALEAIADRQVVGKAVLTMG